MRRNKSLIPLSHDHFHGLIIAQLIKKGNPPYHELPEGFLDKVKCTLEFYKYDLKKHYTVESEVLYPFVKGRDITIDKMFDQLFEEQQKILSIIDSLKTANDVEDRLNVLGHTLENSIRKEERQLFSRIELVLPYERLNELEGKIIAAKGHNIKRQAKIKWGFL